MSETIGIPAGWMTPVRPARSPACAPVCQTVQPDRARTAAYQLDAFAAWLTPASHGRRAAARAVLERVLGLSVPPAELVAAAEGAIEEIDLISESLRMSTSGTRSSSSVSRWNC